MDNTIDIYCERIDPTFWAEPLNAVSNGAFLIAAFAAGYLVWQRRPAAISIFWPLINETAIIKKKSLLAKSLSMNRFLYRIFLCILLFFSVTPAFSENNLDDISKYTGSLTMTVSELPKFEDFPIETTVFTNAPLDLSSTSEEKTYKTRLMEYSKGPPNFAGIYRIVSIGCGSNCQRNWIINLKTGKILKDSYIQSTSHGLLYTTNSRLLIGNPPYRWADTNVTKDFNSQSLIGFFVLDLDKQELEPIRQLRMEGLF